MTDLATTQLQHLLDQATTGPWEAKDSDCITSEHGEVLWNTDRAADWNRNDHDVNLAAHAPELAGEVLRMRKELTNLQEEARLVAELYATQLTPQRILDALDTTINKILGDHDE